MYLEHFGLRELPFSITPDTSFIINTDSHQQAMNVLLVALRSGEGFIKITGEVGTGKTLLCRRMLNIFAEDAGFVTAYIPNPYLNPVALYRVFAEELGIQHPQNISINRILKLINEKLIAISAESKKVILFIDEAQAMPEQSLEALRLLTNLETEKIKLLQIVLFGQPELDTLLNKDSVRQLRQRIIFSDRLLPMNKQEVAAYLSHRLHVAGYAGGQLFNGKVLDRLYKASRGIPRLVNILAHKALIATYGQGAEQVSVKYINAAVNDTEDTCHHHDNLLNRIASGMFTGVLWR